MVEFGMCVLCSDVDCQEDIPVRSFPHLSPPPSLPQIVGYDHGNKPLSVLSTCNFGSCVRSLAPFTKKCIYAGKKELKYFFWKKDYSFQQLEKRFIPGFLRDHNSQRQICRSFPFSSSYQLLGTISFNWLSIGRGHCCLLFTQTLKVGNIICYSYLFHIVFH